MEHKPTNLYITWHYSLQLLQATRRCTRLDTRAPNVGNARTYEQHVLSFHIEHYNKS